MLKLDGKFIQPEESKATIERMAGIAAPVLLFAQEQLVIAEGRSVGRDVLYQTYTNWCEKAGNSPQGRGRFFDTLISEHPGLSQPKRVGERGKQVWMVFGADLRRDADDQEIIVPENGDDLGAARLKTYPVIQGDRQ